MKINYNNFYRSFILLASFVIISCEEDITYKVDQSIERFVVVEGRITNEEKSHLLRITRSDDYFSNKPPSLADVSSYKVVEVGTGNIYAVTKVDTGIGYYITDSFAGIIGEEYKLTIEFQGEEYSAISYLDSVAPIDSIISEYEFEDYGISEEGFYKIKMFALEPDPKGDYYMANLYINDTLFNTKLSSTTFFDDEFINGNYFMGIDTYSIRQEEITQDINEIRLELLSISRDEYNFIIAFEAETVYNGSMFTGPPADVPTNLFSVDSLKRGFGFFAASATVSATCVLHKSHDESTNDPDYKK